MSFFEILDTILLKSLELVFEVIYMMAYKVTGDFGISIIVLSLFMNFLVLPLYMRADAIQEEEHAIEKKLQKGVAHIKRTFRGDERMMILQTYYRQNNYKPIYVLRSALSLLLQIPFFIAAYRFLSGLEVLNGVAFGPIPILGKPDGMLQIGGVTLNALPIIMTAVNLVSCIIFTKGGSLKSKIQLYAMAIFFLVFLYDSPAGLVLYWTLNNVFSLVKTCFYKLKNPCRVFRIIAAITGGILLIYGLFFYNYHYVSYRRKALVTAFGLLLQMPLWSHMMKRKGKRKICIKENRKAFFAGALFLAAFTGAVIPSAVIKASPQEFVAASYFYHPLWYIVGAFCMAFGIFVFWAGVFYYLSRASVRAQFEAGVWLLSGIAVTDYMIFGRNLGLITSQLQFEKELPYTWKEIGVNAVVIIVAVAVLYLLYRKWSKLSAEILAVAMVAVMIMTAVNMVGINSSVNSINSRYLEEKEAQFTLSKKGKNVVVFMLDRAVGRYIPYFFQEKPELKEKFDGFTYYANTISFGAHTNFGVPALFGGYEYTPVEMNKRNEESIAKKHNEALKVMPVLFDENGYQVTVCNPPYAGYQWTPDLSIYDEYPEIDGYLLKDTYTDASVVEEWIQNNKRNFFCYGILKVAPIYFQKTIYDYGRYNQADWDNEMVGIVQRATSIYTAEGLTRTFMDEYNNLCALSDMTKIENGKSNTFLMVENETPHELMMLQEPEYIPAMEVDNTKYEKMNQWRYTVNGETMRLTEVFHAYCYQVNMATLIKVGEWFDYLRENDVYDNTRIILVADHGWGSKLYEDSEYWLEGTSLNYFYPLLMVKDFDSKGFTVSEEFMTNADVPALAVKDIIENPKNPFTGKKIDSSEKTAHAQYVIGSREWDIEKNNGNTFLPSIWYSVHGDMRDINNWKLLSEEETVLPPVESAE